MLPCLIDFLNLIHTQEISGGAAGIGIPLCVSTAGSQYRGEEIAFMT